MRTVIRPRRLVAVAVVIALLGLGGAIAYQRMQAMRLEAEQAPLVAPALDVATMPVLVQGKVSGDQDLAAGIRQMLIASLIDSGGLNSTDARRVDRALTELTYDAEAARRQRARVGEVLGTKELLEVDLEKSAADTYTVRYSLWRPDGTAALWTGATPAVAPKDLPDALRALQPQLAHALGISNQNALDFPDAESMQLIGRLYRGGENSTPKLDPLLNAAQKAADPVLWWSVQEALDRSGQGAEATSAARQAKDALTKNTGRDAQRALAYAEVLLGEYDDAIARIDGLLKTSPTDHPLRLLLARAQAEVGKFDQAQATLEALAREDARNVDAWFLLGKFSIMQGDAKRAVDDYLVRAVVLANRLDDRRMQADVTNAMGIAYRHVGRTSLAAKEFQTASELRGALGDRRGQGVSLRNLATVLAMQGDFRGAEQALSQARTILTALGDPSALADLANDTGVFEEERGEFRRALDAYREALTFRQTQGDARSIGESQINVGYAYYQVGEFDNAEAYWQQASATYARIDDRVGIVHANQVRALGQIARGRFTDAQALLEQSLHEAEQLQMAEERSTSLSALAELDYLRGDIASALDHSAAASEIFKTREDNRGTVEMKLLRAAIFHDVGDWDSADAALGDLSADNVDSREQSAILLLRRGEIALGRSDIPAALDKSAEALAAAQTALCFFILLYAGLM
ncbi:MAG: tetratricopeptide repeat protein, partial [Rhodanobacteraceae bacterium]